MVRLGRRWPGFGALGDFVGDLVGVRGTLGAEFAALEVGDGAGPAAGSPAASGGRAKLYLRTRGAGLVGLGALARRIGGDIRVLTDTFRECRRMRRRRRRTWRMGATGPTGVRLHLDRCGHG